MPNTKPSPTVLTETFDAPKSRASGPKLTPEQLTEVRRAAGKKAAKSRAATLYVVNVRDADGNLTEKTVNGSQLAGMRAAVARRNAPKSKSSKSSK